MSMRYSPALLPIPSFPTRRSSDLYTTPNGCVYDSGDYPKMLAIAKNLIGWDEWKKKQAEARKQGRLIGIGIGTTLDSGTNKDRKSTRLNSSHRCISYAVFCLKKKK